MVFSHGPAGFTITWATQKLWKKGLNSRQKVCIYILGVIFGLLPDVDVVYYYLISATHLHRENITHSPILYLALFILVFVFSLVLKNKFIKSISFIFLFSTFFHLILDSTTAGVPWFFPLSKNLYGLLFVDALATGFYGSHLIVFLYSLEAVFFLFTLGILLFWKYKEKNSRKRITVCLSIIFVAWVFLLVSFDKHLFSWKSDIYYKDFDKDGLMNMRDEDMDGDGMINLWDNDANGNGIPNLEEILEVAKRMEGVWYDITEDRLWEIARRFGFLRKIDTVVKPYDYAGIFIGAEIRRDFEKHPQKYIETPRHPFFEKRIENLFTFLENNDMILPRDAVPHLGDIVFYGENFDQVALVTRVFENDSFFVLEADASHVTMVLPNKEVVKRAGEIKAFGRILENLDR